MRRFSAVMLVAALLSGLGLSAAARAIGSSPAVVKTAYNKTLKATILVDGTGRTLYMYTADPKNVSTCAAVDPSCPKIWPAYTTSGKPTAGSGVKASLLATTKNGRQV